MHLKLYAADKSKVADQYELFEAAETFLLDRKLVKPGFAAALLERENRYPTGLPFKENPVAIPHADPLFVNEDAILIFQPHAPVNFLPMASNPNGETPAQLETQMVLVLALNNTSTHLKALQALMGLLTNDDFRAKLVAAKPSEAIRLLSDAHPLFEASK